MGNHAPDGGSGHDFDGSLPKPELRRRILARRSRLGVDVRARHDAGLLREVVRWVADSLADAPNPVVAAHVPIDTEPGATIGIDEAADAAIGTDEATDATIGTDAGSGFPDALLAALTERLPGVRLLLPVCPPGPPTALDWAEYTGELAPGKYGLPEPVGPLLGAGVIARAGVILVPGLAGDVAGMRMGRGAGYYDRSLAHATGRTALLLHPGEVLDAVPHDAHDLPVDAVLTADGQARR